MLKIPGEFARIGIKRQGGAAVERIVIDRHSAAYGHPRFCLRGSPEGQVEIRVIATGDPGFAAGAEQIRKFAPGVAARLTRLSNRVEPPKLFSGCGIIGADETLFLT